MKQYMNPSSSKSCVLAAAISLSLGAAPLSDAAQITVGAPANSINNNFTMLDNLGQIVGGTNDVVATWDGTMFTESSDYTGPGTVENMTLTSTTPFSANIWTAHDIQVFAPGTYTFDTIEGPALTMQVNPGQVGVHMLFDWGATTDIDVAVVWDKDDIFGSGIGATTDGLLTCGLLGPATTFNCLWDGPTNNGGTTGATVFDMVSIDANGDGKPGIPMVDGPFGDFNASFNLLGIDINTPPVANNDAAGTTVNTAVTINVINNDTDAEDGSPPAVPPASLFINSQPANGTAQDNGNGTVDYTPDNAFSGVDTFQYRLTDSDGATSINAATVTVTVTAAANNPPVANDANFTTDEDTALDIDVDTVATDADGDSLTYATFDPASTQGGSITVDATNTILTYTPANDYNGQDTFTYSVTDGIDNSNVATITMTVDPVNDPLTCTDVTLNTDIGASLDIDINAVLLSTCTDTENDPISLDSTTQPVEPGSTLEFDGVNTLTYTPAPGFTGQDSFTYTATDGTDTDTKTVFVDVGKVFGNFTMIDAGGTTFGGTNDISATWDGSLNDDESDTNFNMTLESDSGFPFFGFPWFAHNIRVFGPGSYSFDTSCTVAQIESGVADCGGAPNEYLDLTIAANQIGAHVLFDWNVTKNIDVVLLWDDNGVFTNPNPAGSLYQGPAGPTPPTDCVYELVSRDADGDTIPGAKMIDGPFIDFRANFNVNFAQNCEGGGEIAVVKSSVNSPDTGCTISNADIEPWKRSDMLLLLALAVWLRLRRKRRNIMH